MDPMNFWMLVLVFDAAIAIVATLNALGGEKHLLGNRIIALLQNLKQLL